MNKNKRFLILIILMMLLSIFKPFEVRAEDELIDFVDTDIVESVDLSIENDNIEQEEVIKEDNSDNKLENDSLEIPIKKTENEIQSIDTPSNDDNNTNIENETLNETSDKTNNSIANINDDPNNQITTDDSIPTVNNDNQEDIKKILDTKNNIKILAKAPKDESNDSSIVEGVQKAKVYITKVIDNEEKTPLAGATLQILNEQEEVLHEWITSTEEYVYELPAGNYILREVKAPDGYQLADDIEFSVEVIIDEPMTSTTVYSEFPVNNTALYYVELDGVEHEVYCINQGLGSPDGIDYSGKIITPDEIRNYTRQETDVDNDNGTYTVKGNHIEPNYETIPNYDVSVSEDEMSNQELYDKTLDIIYRRYLAKDKFQDISGLLSDLGKNLDELGLTKDQVIENTIRWITEYALKNYLNARITTFESERYLKENGYKTEHYRYNTDGEILYNEDGSLSTTGYLKYVHKFYNREYVYDPTAPAGYVISRGNGDSFGNLAKSWNGGKANKIIPSYFADLYYFLISDDGPTHPEDMQLFVYSTDAIHTYEYKGNTYEEPYQNVLGITGYHKNIKVVDQHVTMANSYSDETVSVTVKKVWDDNNNQDGKRPENIVLKLSNGQEVTLSDENDWTVTINDLPKYDKGQKINYTWSEASLPEGYELTDITENGYITTLTNTYTPETTSIKIKKIWDDVNNQEKLRPITISVTLFANGKEYETISLSQDNDWKYTFNDLPVYDDGELIEYSINEEVPAAYEVHYEGNMKEGFVIYNVLPVGGDVPPPENPQTGDNIVLYLITLIISIVGFSTLKYSLKKQELYK